MNIATFCPGRDYVTFNFAMEERHIANIHKVTELLEATEAMDIPPPVKPVREDEAA